MGLESTTYINGLLATNPTATDSVAQADDHIRLIKQSLLNTFPNITTAVTATHHDLNACSGAAAQQSVLLGNSDKFIVNNAGFMKQVALSSLLTYMNTNLSITSSMIANGTIQEADLADGSVSLAKLAPDARGVPSGALMAWSTNNAPNGWLMCYGQNVSRTTYSSLFAAIGTSYGAGDGATTFTLPDLRGRVIAGKDDMGGAAAGRMTDYGTGLGATGGSEHVTLTESELAAHRHLVAKSGYYGPSSSYVALTADNSIISYNIDPDWTQPQENATSYRLEGISDEPDLGRTSETGGGQAHENTQPTIILNYIIKT